MAVATASVVLSVNSAAVQDLPEILATVIPGLKADAQSDLIQRLSFAETGSIKFNLTLSNGKIVAVTLNVVP